MTNELYMNQIQQCVVDYYEVVMGELSNSAWFDKYREVLAEHDRRCDLNDGSAWSQLSRSQK